MDDSMLPAVRETLQADLVALLAWVQQTPDLDLATAEQQVRAGVLALGARLLTSGLAARGTGKDGPWRPCACGGTAGFEGYRSKEVQTLVGWIGLRRAYYCCADCGQGQAPLDARLGVARDSHSPGVRRLASRCGALLPFAQAAATLSEAAGVRLAPSTVRTVTEQVGTRREAELLAQVEAAWTSGLPAVAGATPDLVYVAMDGVRILGTDGEGREAKVGVVVPVTQLDGKEVRAPASYTVSFATAERFGPRLTLEAHRRGVEGARHVVVLGDGAAWIWHLAAEHFPDAMQIVDWYHASERVWELGRALHGEGTAKTAQWVDRQLTRLADGRVRGLVASWRRLGCTGTAALVCDEQVTYFTNQASRMAYDRYRALGLDIGSGMVESACKYVVGARAKGPGMRWSVPGVQAVANLRVLLCNNPWDAYQVAA